LSYIFCPETFHGFLKFAGILFHVSILFKTNFSSMKIYVGNLNYRSTEEEIQQLFSDFGDVKSVQIIKDKMSGRSKGFAFVEMENDAEAKEAIEALHEAEFGQRNLVVNEARPMNPDDRRDNRGGDRGGNRGGGGGRGQDSRRRY
jgi:cold-inducible RNA-binding protein